jgi:hypothetical protein
MSESKAEKRGFRLIFWGNGKKKRIDPKEAFALVKPYLDRSFKIMVAVDPIYASKWVDNANVYAMASALKSHELRTYIRLSKLLGGQTNISNWLKWLVPAGIFMLLLGIAIHMVMNGSAPAPPVQPHPAPTPPHSYNI